MNHHHGMQADERFGVTVTGTHDFDEDGYSNELTAADISALVAWQATLEPPVQAVPDNAQWEQAAIDGKAAMEAYGCLSCHRTSLPLDSLKFHDPGPLDAVGTLSANDVAAPAVYDMSELYWAKSLPRNASGQVLVPLI